jgi:6-phosphofructokinase 2
MNPAVDIATSTHQVPPTHKLRCGVSHRHPGGGGVNVARVVRRLAGDCAALYPAGGDSGELLRKLLDEEGVNSLCVGIASETRENFSVHEALTGREFSFVLPGPELLPSEWQACLDRVAALVKVPRYLVASGSLPPGVPSDFYARMIRLVKPLGVKVVLDSSGPALEAALKERVYLVKPSLRELRDLFGQALETESQWCHAAEQLLEQGRAQVVVISIGEGGAWMVTPEGTCYAPALPVEVISATGAGDSFVGAMVWALAGGRELTSAFRYGVAAATAALLSKGTGLCRAADVAH